MRRLGVVVSCLLPFLLCAHGIRAYAAAGRTVGTFNVSPSGAAAYTIPLWAPPGPHGLQPQLALVYNSRSGNGYLGVGWSLSGLSSIYRCNKTYAQDGAPSAVALTANDGYCLDGQRLRLTSSGDYGEDGSTYQTEIANFSNVMAHGSTGSGGAGGPAYFVVQLKNGWTYEYGNPASVCGSGNCNSQVLATGTSIASEWFLDNVTDRAGNTMTIAYCPIGATGGANCPSSGLAGATVPSSISWTPTSHGATTYAYTTVFNYGSNVAPPTGYQAGTVVNNPYLLNSVQIEYSATGTYPGTTVKDYFLAYQYSSTTGRDLLQTVTECADSGESNCLAPTTVTYQAGAAGVGYGTTLYSGSTSNLVASYDFNGDGRTDIAYYANGTWWVAFGAESGYSSPMNTGITYQGAIFDSVDGTATDDILVPQGGYWYYYKWNGSSFAATSTGAPFVSSTNGSTAIADLNGDGLPDLVSINTSGHLIIQFNTSTSGSVTFGGETDEGFFQPNTGNSFNALSAYKVPGRARPSYSGSGSQDVFDEYCLYDDQGNANCLTEAIEYNNSTIATYSVPGNNTFEVAASASIDFNDDGCADLISGGDVIISACNGQPAATIALPSGYSALAGIDYDGSGRESILAAATNGSLYVFPSEGTTISTTPIYIGIDGGCQTCSYAVIHNPTGDGQDAVLGLSSTDVTYFLHNDTAQPPDLLTTVTDGYGNSASQFTFQSLGLVRHTPVLGMMRLIRMKAI